MGQEHYFPAVILPKNKHGHHKDPRGIMRSFSSSCSLQDAPSFYSFLVFPSRCSILLFILSYLDSEKHGLDCICEVYIALHDPFSGHGYLVSGGFQGGSARC